MSNTWDIWALWHIAPALTTHNCFPDLQKWLKSFLKGISLLHVLLSSLFMYQGRGRTQYFHWIMVCSVLKSLLPKKKGVNSTHGENESFDLSGPFDL